MKGRGSFRVLVPGATLLTKVTLLLSHFLLLHPHISENGFANAFSATTTTVSRGRRSSSSCSPRFVSSSSSFSENDEDEGRGRRRRRSYVATCVPGLSDELVREIRSVLGPRLPEDAVRREGPSGASFETDDDLDGLRVVYWSRIAHRVMETLASTSDHEDEEESLLRDRDDLYDFVRSSVDVRALLGDGRGGLLSLSCRCASSGSGGSSLPEDLRHSHYTALTVKNALVDACREARPDGARPDVDRDDPDVPLVLSLRRRGRGGGASASLSRVLHAGGSSLHRRGHRAGDAVHKAALKESVAAGLLRAAGWDLLAASARDAGEGPAVLLDPTTGGGTLLQEAAYLAADVAPGLLRDELSDSDSDTKPPPCLRWKDFADAHDGWNEMRRDALARAERGRRWLRESGDCRLAGNEIHPRALELARRNLDRGGLGGGVVSTTLGDCGDWRPPSNLVVPGRTIIVANPPWGTRLNDHDDVKESWRSLARFLRREGGGTEAWILSGNKSLTKLLRMRRTRSVPLRTGEQDLRWIQYHIFDDRNSDDDDDRAATNSRSK